MFVPGLAFAASAAVLAVVALPMLRVAQAPPTTLASSAGEVQAPSPARLAASGSSSAEIKRAPAAPMRDINGYLVAHREFAGGVFPRAVPYLRTAASIEER
jgi:hypothetical protein